jgi:hypothetical protein
MNYKLACKILDLDEIDYKNNKNKYKKQYKFFALKYHPDKNNDGKDNFLQIHEAYDFLKVFYESSYFEEVFYELKQENLQTEYEYLLFDFLNCYACPIFISFIANLLLHFDSPIELENKFDENTFNLEQLWELYNFLKKYNNILHISDKIFTWLRSCIQNKYENESIIYLNPGVSDLLECNCFKLWEGDNYYIVPLWHNEIHFDIEGTTKKIMVFCEPEIKELNVEINEKNEIIVEHELKIDNLLLDNENVIIMLGKKQLKISLETVFLKRIQYIRIVNQGIPKINKQDIYNIEEKNDIIVKLILL